MNRSLQHVCLCLALSLIPALTLPQSLYGQELSSTKGGLQGVITDKSGAILPGAKVTISGAADTRTATTDQSGHFVVTDLTPGAYTVTVEKAGFKSDQAKSVGVVINRISSLDLSLEVGGASETVNVDATTTEIDTTSTAIGANLTSSFYNQVPVARNVGSLFYTAPGVTNGGGTGTSNPSIGGASGLENEYVADGVNIGDAGYGGLGVFSPTYGSLGTGINLTFIEEVQVKTGAFEPKYGSANGGVVQIVTKSGGTQYHGALSAYFSPQQFFASFRQPDDFFNRQNVHGRVYSIPQYDAAAEFGGYVPGPLKNKLFFYGAYNPALNQYYWRAPAGFGLYNHGPFTNSTTVNSWAAKLTYKLSDSTAIDASAFGDPSRTNAGYGFVNSDTFPYYPSLAQNNETGFSRWNYGSRSESLHLTSTPSPTWEFSLSASAKTSHFTEVGLQDAYQIVDLSKAFSQSSFNAQGLGFSQNPQTHTYSFGIDTSKTVTVHGVQNVFSIGWDYLRDIYDLTKSYSGASFTFPTANDIGTPVTSLSSNPGLSGATADAAFNLRASSTCTICPNLNGKRVYLQQTRGIFSNPVTPSSMSYHAIYGNDNVSIGHRITINAGIRWDEEQLNGIVQQYVFNDNWSPRLGINFDPKGDRKSKIFFNFGRYTQSLPEDAAIRSLGQELDISAANWAPLADASGNAVLNQNGTVTPVLDAAHLISGDPAAGSAGSNIAASGSVPENILPKTKLNFEEEFVGGVEKQFGGFVLSARYTDRRLLRIIEDQSGASPEGNLSGNVAQNFEIGNPSSSSDYFVNEVETPYVFNANLPNDGAPANCVVNYNVGNNNLPFTDSLGNIAGEGGACGNNPANVGLPTPDGKPDGQASARRHYQAIEVELNKNFSHNFLLRVNYRWAKLYGNYEGLFRNDNGQSDPGISSLFDFTPGVLGLLGQQFARGFLNTDRRQIGNLYGSYVLPSGFAKKLTIGTGFRASSGQPINNLGAHPVYQNAGEIPFGGRGSEGRNASNYQLDLHTDYPVSLGEKYKLKLTFDAFNVTNSRSLTSVDQDSALSFGVPNTDFLKPLSFQRPFYGRGSIRFEF
jgi:hypothetical protein